MQESKEPDTRSRLADGDGTVAATEFTPEYWRSLVAYAGDLSQDKEEPPLGEFGKLQAMNITHLMNEIVRIKGNVGSSETTSFEEMNLLRKFLHHYSEYLWIAPKIDPIEKWEIVNSIRDFKYMNELNHLPPIYTTNKRILLLGAFQALANPNSHTPNQPYDTTYHTLKSGSTQNKDSVREFLRRNLPKRFSWTGAEIEARGEDYMDGKPPQIYSPFLDSLARFLIGTLGGCSLIVPMIIMVLHQSLTKSLITVSVAVVLFSLILSLVFKTNNQDTITATATYAAVLVVFVGTSGSAGGSW
jgi:hypothetical protein